MLKIENISIEFDGKILFSDLSFVANYGEIVCITGASGLGKTTLLRAILGLVPLTKGRIIIENDELSSTNIATLRRKMSYVPQDISLLEEQVCNLCKLPFLLKANKNTPFSKQRLMKEWRQIALDETLFYRKTSFLSGGQRQRIMLSICIMLNKQILLIDEPTAALDKSTAILVAEYIKKQANKDNVIIVVSHDEEVISIANKIITI